MKLKQLQLKTSLSILVLFLSLLTFAAVGTGWYSLQQSSLELSTAPQSAIIESIVQRFEQVRYVFIGLLVLAVLLGVIVYRTLSRTVLKPLQQVSQYFDRIAAGDLTHRIDVSSHNEIGLLYLALKRMQDSLGRAVGTVRVGMEHINNGGHQLVAGNADLSGRTDEQAAVLQQTAASMEQLASTVKQNADNARQANQLAASASEVAQRGGQAVGQVVNTMQGISDSSRKISEIVGVIDSIAFQTNILALNAAVEAARAGEQGKGFAVVASEVRALAQRSAQAAKEIKALIDDSVKKVTEGSGQVERAGATMQEIVTSVARVTDIMGEISAATAEQSTGIDQINRAVTQMDSVTQQNALLVQQATTSAADLREHVAHVSGAVSVFRLVDNQVIDVAATSVSSRPAPAKAHLAKPQRSSAGIAIPATPENRALNNRKAASPASARSPARQTAPDASSAARYSAKSGAAASGVSKAASLTASPAIATRGAPSDDDWEEF
ncbi:MAG TPA: methyl-accepting chemotaxis protein [Eoetvoesiella sp.]